MSEASHTIGTPESFELGLRLGAIFLPHAKRQTEKFYTQHGEIKAAARFVHYTTAEAALENHWQQARVDAKYKVYGRL